MKIQRLFKFAALLFVCCAMLGCGKEEDSSNGGGKGSIYGTVTDFATGEPVRNANVQLLMSGNATLHASITGSDGHYEIPDVPCGTYSIKVTKVGYSDLIDNNPIVIEKDKSTKRDLQIKKLPSSLHIYDNESHEISELNFGADEGVTQKTFNIFNGGEQTLNYVITIPTQANWVSISDSQLTGTIGVNVTYPIIVTINRELLADGNNIAVLTITSATDGGKELTIKARKSSAENGVFELPSAGLMVQTVDRGCVDWYSAKLLCENSTVAGYNDWRLPTKEELAALFDNKEQIGGFEDEGYWSSSNYGSNYYYVDFSNGIAQRAFSNNDHYYVRAVRTWDNSAPISLLDNSNNVITELDFGSDANTTQKTFKIKNTGTQNVGFEIINTANWVSTNPESGELGAGSTTSVVVMINRNLLSNGDNTTSLLINTPNNGGKELVVKAKKTATNSIIELPAANLMVQTQDLGYVDWYSAKSMCENSFLAGYDDWRLPTQAELMTLWDNKDYIGGFYTTGGSGKAKYWSSGYNSNGNPVGVNFYDGSLFYDGAMASHSVRAVRTLNGGGGGGFAPSAPTGVSAEVSNSRIKVSWNSVSNADSYTVYWSNDGIMYNYEIGTTSNTYIFDDAPSEYNYYKVKAKNSYGESPFSSSVYCHYSSGGGSGQTYTYDFEDGWQGWQVIDADGDGYTWNRFYSSDGNLGHNGSVYIMGSESYNNDIAAALYPDNYLVSPQRYSISNGAKISFYVCAQDADYPAEHYGVAVSTQTTPDSDDFVTIWEGTLSAKLKSGGKIRGNRTQGTWYLKTVDLSAYAGQNIWIAIRHFNCYDEFMIDVDDISIKTGY